MRAMMGIWLVMAGLAWGQEVCGDCDHDNAVTVLDSLLAAQHGVRRTLPGHQARPCDVDSSGTVDVLDALRIAQDAVGLSPILACQPPPPPWIERFPAIRPAPRTVPEIAYDSVRQQVVLFGGSGYGVQYDTWLWDGVNWAQYTGPVQPTERSLGAMTFDPVRGVTVLFGGEPAQAGDFSDVWEFDGTNWVLRAPQTRPYRTYGCTMEFDVSRGVSVMFGGFNYTQGWSNATWEWNGIDWVERFPPVSPPPRESHAMVYDSARGVMVVFGGLTQGNIYFGVDDTWEYDGVTWWEVHPVTVPYRRCWHAMTYDQQRGVTVMFGGYPIRGDTWEYDGVDWSRVYPYPFPHARDRHGMTYDSVRGRIVLFGGNLGWDSDDTWER